MTLKEYVIGSINPDRYYEARFPKWNSRARGNVRCPFHGDTNPSLALGLHNGGARCHASTCKQRIGNIVHFEAVLKGVKEKKAAFKLYQEFIRPIVSLKTVLKYKTNLQEEQTYILRIRKEMGLSLQSIRKYSLGLDLESHRITIPVYDQWENCVNIRFYRLPSQRTKSDKSKIYNLNGHGRLDLFPFSSLTSNDRSGEPIYFMAGEKDCLLANDRGLRAITSTTGEGSWDGTWNHYFEDKLIYLVFDRDDGGTEGASRIRKLLGNIPRKIISVSLPFKSARSDRKDFTDWILKEGGTVEQLELYIKKKGSMDRAKLSGQPPRKIPPSVSKVWDERGKKKVDQRDTDLFGEREVVGREYPKLPGFSSEGIIELVAISSRSELLNKQIRTQGIVAAKSPNTFSIPWKFIITAKNRIPFTYKLPMGRELLSFIGANDTAILHRMQDLIGSKAEVTPVEYLTATQVEIIPIAVVDRDVPYVVQRCYYLGDRIESNIPYLLEVIPTSEIRTQETIGIITKFIPLSRSIDRFDMTAETMANLSVFRTEGEGVWNKLKSIANEIADHYTNIRNRMDWHIIALLTWASPIGWRFPVDSPTSEPHRGWLNSLALGDSQTGKSEVAKNLRKVFNAGVFVNSENCTLVGLVGGAIKMGSGQLMLRWGRIPLCDRGMVILEELSGLSVKEISDMSDLRSSGKAHLDKGGINAETNARTRLLCLSNVRSERRRLADYLFGVHAIREVVGHGEDIARFDLISTLVDSEVSNEIINSSDFALSAKTISSDQLQTLIHFIWSLKPEQILFSNESYEACLEHTKKLATEFHPSIPIFKGGSGRYKLGRIAAAIACFQFSWNDEQGYIEVLPEHVEAAVRLLRMCYCKRSLGYDEYSRQMFERETIKNEKEIEEAFTDRIPRQYLASVLETLIHSTRFSRDELCAIAGLTILHSDMIIGALLRNRAIRKGDANLYEIVPQGKRLMEQMMKKVGRPLQRKTKTPPRKVK